MCGQQHWETGKVRPLAVSTPTRFSLMPELPTVAETRRWRKLMGKPEHAAFNQKYGLESQNGSIEQTQAFLNGELDRMTTIARRANIKLE